ncbi:MAG: phosphate ABC transporter substrate-binding protein PstS [Burkholderiaceae bacterium]
MTRNRLAALAMCCLGLSTPCLQAQTATIEGAGATFPARVYEQWIQTFSANTGVAVAYAPVGSSNGRKRITAGEVDFGASDVPMDEAALLQHQLFQFPTLVGGVVPVVNLPGVPPGALRLSNEVLAAIFAGIETQWDAPSIRALNPTLNLPRLPIQRVVRKDGSGTTEVFLSYLHAVGGEAAQRIQGKGGHAEWPGSALAVQGSGEQSATVKATPGAIGYISSDYVARNGLSGVQLQNRRGHWVKPTLASFRAAILGGGLFKDSLQAKALINVDGTAAWPIVTATYILVPRQPKSVSRAAQTLNFFYQSFLLGDKAVAGSGFAPLPSAIQAKIVAELTTFRTANGEPIQVFDPQSTRQPSLASGL